MLVVLFHYMKKLLQRYLDWKLYLGGGCKIVFTYMMRKLIDSKAKTRIIFALYFGFVVSFVVCDHAIDFIS